MEFYDFISMFIRSREKELENKIWQQWLAILPNMTEENFITYEEMLEEVKGSTIEIKEKEIVTRGGYYVDQVFF